ncbi:MAG: DNA methyltransferase [Candidatus Kapaibacteriota bacterium]
MPHRSDTKFSLSTVYHNLNDTSHINTIPNDSQVYLLMLPTVEHPGMFGERLIDIASIIERVLARLGSNSTLLVLGDVIDAVRVHEHLHQQLRFQSWISIRREQYANSEHPNTLPHTHSAMLVYTRYQKSLQHTKTRIEYSYCPACEKTTKDYGGKKHTYDAFGTLMSDVWREITYSASGDASAIVERCADVFAVEPYSILHVIDCRDMQVQRQAVRPTDHISTQHEDNTITHLSLNTIQNGDCLTVLAQIPDNSVDFIFVDPPYNLKKAYASYTDDREITQYFEWCDSWLTELVRVLKPGRTLSLLNIPLWCIRHFAHLETIALFQNWIVWDALSYPVRQIMPAHYPIICFTKGAARELPAYHNIIEKDLLPYPSQALTSLRPLKEGFCIRAGCVEQRRKSGVNDRDTLTDMWHDIHRLKHNSRRVDHPTQLPPTLLYRLIQTFTYPNEIVLDCFNGAGTTTLCAHQLQRQYIGIELSEKYAQLSQERHGEIEQGIDPFRKEERTLTAKNSVVPRLKKQKYRVPKKTLQLEVKRIADLLGRLPNREQVAAQSIYPIELYDEYFSSWGEVCAAARNTGMTETKNGETLYSFTNSSLSLFDLESS